MSNKKTTELDSLYDNLESMPTGELISSINLEDQKVADCIKKIIPQIVEFVDAAFDNISKGGRLFYIGAGTSGRLGILDASECPPTFGVNDDIIIGLIAGGDGAIRKAVEFAEDSTEQAWKDLENHNISSIDVVLGLTASGTTPYVIGALKKCNEKGILTSSISCNSKSPVSEIANHPIEIVVGPEFVTGSTRMKSGTAQKMILNMISTSIMIKLGRIQGNKMVDMQLSNNKLIERGTLMLMNYLNINRKLASELLKKHKSVREAIEYSK